MSSSKSKRSSSSTAIQEDYVFSNTGDGDAINLGKTGGDVTITGTDGETAIAALEEGRKLADSAFESAFGFGTDALETTGDTFRNALTANGDVIRETFDSLENIVRNTSSQVDRSLKVAESSLTDDSAETLQSLFKYGAIAVAAGAAIYAFGKR